MKAVRVRLLKGAAPRISRKTSSTGISRSASGDAASSGRLGHDGDDLLRQHVQRVTQKAGGFHQVFVHGARDRGARYEVGAILGKNHSFTGCAHVVPGPADALHGTGYRRGSFNLDHQVDCAHVDAQFERRGRHQRAQTPGLQLLFDLRALRGGEGAVVSAGQLLSR